MNIQTQREYKQADPATFDWWKAALKGQIGDINPNEPMQGYYRSRSKNKQTGEERLYAVAYWWKNGACHCQVDQQIVTGEKLERMIAGWPYIAKNPVSYETWCSVVKEGKPWPDQHVHEKAAPAEASNQPLDAKRCEQPAAGAADQSKAEEELTPQGKLRAEIAQAKAGLARYVKKGENGQPVSLIESDDMAGAAQSLRAALLALANKAKKAREDANRPHNDAIRANGLIYTPLETEAKAAADALRDGPMKAWEVHKREQAAAAQKAALAAQQAAVASGNPAPVQPASNAPAPAARIKGATGKAASVSTVKIAVIHDQDAVYAHFRDNDQLKAILQGLANGAVRAGITVPGVTVTEDVSIK